MARVLLFGAAWIALLAALTVAVGPHQRPRPVVTKPASATLPAPPPKVGARYAGWTVTRAYSAHHMMIVEVETDHLANTLSIAAQLVEPLKGSYDEILIYIRQPDQRPDDLPARRIQWTRRAGYVESVYAR